MGIYNFIHKKSAAGHVSGVTEESNIDIIEGEYTLAGVKTGIKMTVPVKVEYVKKRPYYCWGKKHLHTTENEEIAKEWEAKGHRVRFVN